jgi:molecular chaperone DnaK (HSP70)
MTYSLGVDLGTTFVAAAVARPTGIAMVPLGDQAVVAPAVVAVRPDGSIVTGDAAERRAVSQPALVARGLKRRLGDPEPVGLGDVSYPVATLLGAQLRDVVTRVSDREGGPAERIVLSHPTTWTPTRRGRFEEVARAAGLEAPLLVTDAEAAVQHAAPSRLRDGGIVAVYDLGGGGFEATVVRTGPGGPEILGTPEGTDVLGGADIDEAILSYVDDAVGGALARLDLDDARTAVALARLRQDCVLAKETLSLDTEAVVPVFLPGRHFEIRLNRTTFEQMLRAPLQSTLDALSHAVRSAGLSPADVDAVLLVGGSTRIPMVAEMLGREFGRPLLEGVHPVHAVALGAAALAAAPAGYGAVPAGYAVASVNGAGDGPWATSGAAPVSAAAALDRPAVPGRAEGAQTRDPGPADASTFVDTPDEPTAFLELPRLESAPDAQPAAWSAPTGPHGFPTAAPAPHDQPWPPPSAPAAKRGGPSAGAIAMGVGAALAVLVLVLVFVLAP